VSRAAFSFALLCLAGCLPTRTPTKSWCDAPASLIPGEVWTTVYETAVADSAIVAVCAVVRADVGPMASYLGELRYDSTRVTVRGVLPIAGGTRKENPLEAGRIRFAGVLADGTRATPLLLASIRARQPIGITLSLQLQELNAPDGSALLPRVRVTGYPPEASAGAP
jgi:hypothetical protein